MDEISGSVVTDLPSTEVHIFRVPLLTIPTFTVPVPVWGNDTNLEHLNERKDFPLDFRSEIVLIKFPKYRVFYTVV